MESDSVLAVGCLNNDRSVLAKSYAWRPLALLPILKGSACVETNDDWVRHRRMELYHSSMDHIIADINQLCSKDMYLRFADGQVRCSRPFYHLLVMDGQEVFFNTFDPISLTPESCMQRKGVPRLYERAASQVPSLYVCPVENVLGRVPLIPCYLNGNSVNTIPHCFRGKIPREAAADSRPDSGTGSWLFEINMWMWRYGRTFPRQISVDQAVELRKKRVQESRARGAETLRRRRDAALAKGASAPQ